MVQGINKTILPLFYYGNSLPWAKKKFDWDKKVTGRNYLPLYFVFYLITALFLARAPKNKESFMNTSPATEILLQKVHLYRNSIIHADDPSLAGTGLDYHTGSFFYPSSGARNRMVSNQTRLLYPNNGQYLF